MLIEHLSKYRSLFPSLALIFHLIDKADGAQRAGVSADSALMALAWCAYLERHARRIYGLVNQSLNQAVIKLARKIQEGELTTPFTIRDIYRKEWKMLTDKKIILAACNELESARWLRLELPEYQGGRPQSPMYVINPKLRINSPTEENIF
ncbi:hypothetical protein AQUSIP_02730 [Aquicella siphonis]|uniref:Uncharacterized protein n=1 Tax=Aquicella siphonis TaxID=254247 RepID=A0A5E4PDI9_9COXI|nr:DUF3987 domain-containing protein [Aquicella siphonis]VVC74999.1 hypothetical protein AQUSIP_02730 [Aquicella siphonis]